MLQEMHETISQNTNKIAFSESLAIQKKKQRRKEKSARNCLKDKSINFVSINRSRYHQQTKEMEPTS